MKSPTFKELVAGIIAVLSVCALITIYFCPTKGNPEITGSIVAAFLLSFQDVRSYLFGSTSGSQAKDEATVSTTNKLIDSLKDSEPSKNV